MAKTQTKKQATITAAQHRASQKRAKSALASKSKSTSAVATRKTEKVAAFAYDGRVPIMADELRHRPTRSATVQELFDALESEQFRTPRRVAATYRADQRSESPVFERGTGGIITLRKRTRTTANGKSGNGRVSTRKTRNAK